MPDRAQSLLLTQLIDIGYDDRFLASPEAVATVRLAKLGFKLVSVIYGVDFKGLFGQQTVPYGTISTNQYGAAYVALRGTDGAKEWLEDAFAVPEPWPFSQSPGVCTHKGFTDLYLTLADSQGKGLLGALAGNPAIVTGHSLGGALATLCGAVLGASCTYLETFEAPRVGNKSFTAWMDSRVPNHYRNVIIGDLVPHAPPELLGYDHAGVEVDFDPAPLGPLPDDPLLRARELHILSSCQALLNT